MRRTFGGINVAAVAEANAAAPCKRRRRVNAFAIRESELVISFMANLTGNRRSVRESIVYQQWFLVTVRPTDAQLDAVMEKYDNSHGASR
jgi:hypothetical protein